MKKILLASAVLAAITLTLSSCVKKKFDTPPDTSSYDPQLTVTHTIDEIKNFPMGIAIDTNATIMGIVVMDDRSGNYYKKIVIQDSTGGIEILVDQNNLYNDYPVGRKVYVNLKGLYLGEYGQNQQLGYTPDASGSVSNIPFVETDKYIVKANYPNPVKADTLTLSELKNPDAATKYLNTLVVIKDVEFASSNSGIPYAQVASLASATNRTISDCNGGSLTLRTSGYANFQPLLTPTGNGTIIGIYTRYNNTPQLYIRDTSDVQFYGERCKGPILNETFDNLDGWNVISVVGDQKWGIGNFGNPRPCALMSGFQSGNHENEDWLITKELNFNGYNTITLTFESASKYNGNPLQCYISENYSGSGDPNSAAWTLLPAAYDQSNNFVFTNSGAIDLSSYKNKKIYIAFKYTSTSSSAATWEIDNVKVQGE